MACSESGKNLNYLFELILSLQVPEIRKPFQIKLLFYVIIRIKCNAYKIYEIKQSGYLVKEKSLKFNTKQDLEKLSAE